MPDADAGRSRHANMYSLICCTENWEIISPCTVCRLCSSWISSPVLKQCSFFSSFFAVSCPCYFCLLEFVRLRIGMISFVVVLVLSLIAATVNGNKWPTTVEQAFLLGSSGKSKLHFRSICSGVVILKLLPLFVSCCRAEYHNFCVHFLMSLQRWSFFLS